MGRLRKIDTPGAVVLGGLPPPKVQLLADMVSDIPHQWGATLIVGGAYYRHHDSSEAVRGGALRVGGANGDGGSELRTVAVVIGSPDWRDQRDAKFYFSRAMEKAIHAECPPHRVGRVRYKRRGDEPTRSHHKRTR